MNIRVLGVLLLILGVFIVEVIVLLMLKQGYRN